jgi:hypothetical protein
MTNDKSVSIRTEDPQVHADYIDLGVFGSENQLLICAIREICGSFPQLDD